MSSKNLISYYRTEYLRSKHWEDLRVRKLNAAYGYCAICKHRDMSNDVHHLNYRNLFDVKLSDLLVLCRNCHDSVHAFLDAKKKSPTKGEFAEWEDFRELWALHLPNVPELRAALIEMRKAGKTPKDKKTLMARKHITYGLPKREDAIGEIMVTKAKTVSLRIEIPGLEHDAFSKAAEASGCNIMEWFLTLGRKYLERVESIHRANPLDKRYFPAL